MREPRLEPKEDNIGCCPYCGRNNLAVNFSFCRDCNDYICRDTSGFVESFEDWLDQAFEDKLKAQGYL